MEVLTQSLGPLCVLFAPTIAIEKHLKKAIEKHQTEKSCENL